MTDEFSYHPVAFRLAVLLHSSTDVADSVSGKGCRDAAVETFLRSTEQATGFLIHLSDTECIAGVTTESVKTGTTVHRYDVTVFKGDIVRYAMDDHIVDRRAQACRKRFCPCKAGRKTLERGSCTVVADKLFGQCVQLSGCDTRPHNFRDFGKCCANQQIGFAQQLDFFFCLQINHRHDS